MKLARPTLLLLLSVLCAADAGSTLPSVDVPLSTGASAPQDYAVVIGIEEYGFLPRVDYAQHDADAFASFARSTRGIPSSRVMKLIGQPSRAQILNALDEAGRSTSSGGVVWVYFSGHGAADPTTAQRVLLPVETTKDTAGFQANGISTAEVERRVTSGGGRMMLITDACFGGAGRDRTALLPGGHLAISIDDRAPAAGSSWVATQPNEVAGPLRPAEHGAFTYAVLGALRGWADGALDNVRDGTVTSEEADAYVGVALRELGINDQRPKWSGVSMTLVKGRLESAPELQRVSSSPTAVQAVVSPVTHGTSFGGSSSSSSLAQALHDAECHDASAALAAAAQTKRLDAESQRIQGEAASAWSALSPTVAGFLRLPNAQRGAVIAEVESFLSKARGAATEDSGGFETVTPTAPVGCAAETLPVRSSSRSLTLPEVAKAEAALAALKAPLAVAGPTVAGAASSAGAWSAGQGVQVARIPAGTFTMGSPTSESERQSDEAQVTVTLSHDALMMTTEVTQGLYRAVTGTNPSRFSSCGATCPVENVSWLDTASFANALSVKDGLTPAYAISGSSVTWTRGANGWRLPTEAEWERAARGGQATVYAGSSELDAVGWYSDNSGSSTHAACGKTPNAYGLCDMSGNVWEWTWDWYAESRTGALTDPAGPASGSGRVIRGGGWNFVASDTRVAIRFDIGPGDRGYGLGFRLLRSLP